MNYKKINLNIIICNIGFNQPKVFVTFILVHHTLHSQFPNTRVGAKFVQDGIRRETFVHNFMTSIIFYQSDMCTIYLNPLKRYDHPQF
jgi:hypothetical protein